MTHNVIIAVGAVALLAMSSVVALADSSQRGQSAYDTRDPNSYDYNVPLALPPYGYAPSFWAMAVGATTTGSGTTGSMGKSQASLTRARSNRGHCAELGFKSPRACLGTAVIQLCYSPAPEHEFA